MVLGSWGGAELARRRQLDVLFLMREGETIRPRPVGVLFA